MAYLKAEDLHFRKWWHDQKNAVYHRWKGENERKLDHAYTFLDKWYFGPGWDSAPETTIQR